MASGWVRRQEETRGCAWNWGLRAGGRKSSACLFHHKKHWELHTICTLIYLVLLSIFLFTYLLFYLFIWKLKFYWSITWIKRHENHNYMWGELFYKWNTPLPPDQETACPQHPQKVPQALYGHYSVGVSTSLISNRRDWFCLFLRLHVHGIIYFLFLGGEVWLLQLSILFVRFIYIVVVLVLLFATYIPLSEHICACVGGYLDNTQLGTIIRRATKTFFMCLGWI